MDGAAGADGGDLGSDVLQLLGVACGEDDDGGAYFGVGAGDAGADAAGGADYSDGVGRLEGEREVEGGAGFVMDRLGEGVEAGYAGVDPVPVDFLFSWHVEWTPVLIWLCNVRKK